jgi:hypothetical protein
MQSEITFSGENPHRLKWFGPRIFLPHIDVPPGRYTSHASKHGLPFRFMGLTRRRMERSQVSAAPVALAVAPSVEIPRWQGTTLSAARPHETAVHDLKVPVLPQYPYRRETGPRLIPKLSSGGKVMEPSVLVRLVTARPCSLASRTILFISKQVSHSM